MSRAAGVLLHVSSLPESPGIGDLGPGATRFVRWLDEAGFRFWQVLPLTPVTAGGSPYDSLSAFAGNTHLLSPELLHAEGLLPQGWLDRNPAPSGNSVDFEAIDEWKDRMVHDSWRHVGEEPEALWRKELETWAASPAQKPWLEDWALFRAIRDRFDGASWLDWDKDIRERKPETLEQLRNELVDERNTHRWGQWIFWRQWHNVHQFARRHGVKIIGDLPIYVALDSVDVWANPSLFKLDADRSPTVVAGVPPDYFAADGQRWGNPIYDWEAHRRTNYTWWIERIHRNLQLYDLVRLDHFRGFAGYWEIPASEKTARNGQWQRGPGRELFMAAHEKLGELPLIAEDLGIITDDVDELRDDLGLPGMRVIQFGFGEKDSMHLPHHYPAHVVGYTGTHDNDTFRGWFEKASPESREHAVKYLQTDDPAEAARKAVEAVLRSDAGLAMIPLQDLLGLGSEGRLNTPGTTDGNWRWRAPDTCGELLPASSVRRLLESTGRAAEKAQREGETHRYQ